MSKGEIINKNYHLFWHSARKYRFYLRTFLLAFAVYIYSISSLSAADEYLSLASSPVPVSHNIRKNETHIYTFDLQADEFISFNLEKEDLRFVLNFTDPDGNLIHRVVNRRFGNTIAWIIGSRPGTYKLSVRSLEKDDAGYAYKLLINERRYARQNDFALFKAEEKFQQAEELRNRWNAEASRSALELYTDAARIWTRLDSPRNAALAYQRIGEINLILGDYQKSFVAHKEALLLSKKGRDVRLELEEMCDLAQLNLLIGNFSQAKTLLDDLETRLRRHNSKSEGTLTALLFNYLGEIEYARGDLKKARVFFERALKIWQHLKHRRGMATAYLNLGYTDSDAGEVIAAGKDFEKALALWREMDDLRGEALTLTAQGNLSSFLNDWEASLNLQAQVREIFAMIGDPQGEAVALNAMGYVYEVLNRPLYAIDCYRRALQINIQLGNEEFGAVTAFALAHAYRTQKNYLEAEKYYRESLEVCRKLNKSRIQAYILRDLAAIKSERGDNSTALGEYQRTLSFYRQIGDFRGEVLVLRDIGTIYRRQNDLSSARKHYEAALNLSRRMGDGLGAAEVLYLLAETELECENFALALSLVEESISLSDRMRGKLVSPLLRSSYQTTRRQRLELQIDILMQMGGKNGQPELTPAALEKVEQSRARTLLEMLNEARIQPRVEVDTELLKREIELQNKLAEKVETQMRLRASPSEQANLEEVDREVIALTAEHDRVEAQLKASNPQRTNLIQPQFTSPSEIIAALQNDPNTVYLAYFLGERRSYLWLATASAIYGYELEPRRKLEESVRDIYQLLSAPHLPETNAAYCRRAENLSRQLLGAVADKIKEKRLLVSLDGALNYVPLEALPSPGGAGFSESLCGAANALGYVPILETNEVSYLPSFSILTNLRRNREKNNFTSEKELAIWADPVYERDDSRLRANNVLSTKSASQLDDAREADLAEMQFGRLLNTRLEANRIIQLFTPEKASVFEDFAANRERLKDEDLRHYRILHFAAHGVINNSHPQNSGILLSLFEEDGSARPGLLSLNDIFRLRINADLVVLSACQTGLGDELSGEGLMGLKQGFFFAGTKSSVLSLWQVNDEATADLMQHFYFALIKKRLPAATALRQAKLEIYRQKGWQNPYFWAAFTFHGEYLTAIPASTASPSISQSFPAVIFLLIIVAGGFYFVRRRLLTTGA